MYLCLEPPGPLVVAGGAHGLGLPVLEHERLQDGGERGDADAGGHLKCEDRLKASKRQR